MPSYQFNSISKLPGITEQGISYSVDNPELSSTVVAQRSILKASVSGRFGPENIGIENLQKLTANRADQAKIANLRSKIAAKEASELDPKQKQAYQQTLAYLDKQLEQLQAQQKASSQAVEKNMETVSSAFDLNKQIVEGRRDSLLTKPIAFGPADLNTFALTDLPVVPGFNITG
jgi:SNF2 family DNA or RNA helicase